MRRIHKRTEHCPYSFAMPNAGRQARLEAEAKRKLEAVACTRVFGSTVAREPP